MLIYKTSKADLRRKYSRNLKISFILSISFLIAAFKFSPDKSEPAIITEQSQELISLINIEPTKQPQIQPKIKPLIPEISIVQEPEDIEFNTTELITDAAVGPPPVRTDINKKIDDETIIFEVVEQLPSPVGGIAAIQNKIHYSEMAKRIGIEGRVIILAIIGKDGDIMNATIIKSLFPSLDEIALNAIKNTKFIPGRQRGKPVNVKMYIPVSFKLQ